MVPPRHVFVTAGCDFTGCKYREVPQITGSALYSGGSRPGIGDDIHRKGGHRGRFPRVGLLGGRRGVRLMQPITYDIADALDVCRNNVNASSEVTVQRSGLTATSNKGLTEMWDGRKS